MGKKNLFPNGPVATFEENTKKVIENGKKGSTDGGAASKSYVIMQSNEEGRKRENNFSASTQKSTGFAFKPFEPWIPKGGFGSLHREDTDVSVPLVLADGKRYGNVTKTAFEAIRSGNISSYVPVNMEEQVTLSRFVTSPVISLETESGKNFGRVSIAAYDAIVNGGLDKYASHNDEEKETLRKYNAYLSGKVASNVKTLSSEVKKLNDIYETAKGYRSEAHIARNMAATWKSRSNGLTADLDYSVKAKQAEKKLREYLKSVGYESIEDIAKALDEKNTELKHAEIAKKGEKLSAVADPLSQEYDLDFNKKSKYNPEKIPLITIGTGKRIYEYINAEGADKAKYAYENEYAVYDEMTSREKALYNYYYNQLGSDKASEYLSTIEEALHRRAAQKKFDKIKGNRWEELLQVPYLGTNQAVTGIKNAFNAKDEYIPYNQGQILSGMINEDIPDDTAWQVAFDLGSTTFNMVPSIAAGIIHPAAGAVMMGVSSAGNTYQDKLNSGMDKGKARVYSSIVGFSEAGLSYLLGGISKLGGKLTNNALNKMVLGIDNAAARFAFTYGGKVASEAFEESLQTVLEPFFENLVLGYMKNKDIDWGEVVYSGLLGALSAGILEAPGVYSQTFGANSKAKQMGADIRSAGGISEVMDIALSSPAESDARRLSVLYKDRGITGDNISDLQVGRLHQLSKENVREVLESKKSTADEKIKAVAMLGKLNELSGVQDEVYYSKESNDSENKSIIQQLREKISDIMLSPVVADIRFDTDSEKTVPEMKAEIVQTLASRGKETDVSVERKGFGTVDLSYKKLKDGVKYLHYPEEIYSLPYVAEVVKNGIQVYYEKNHKTTGNESFTFAAPVNINGKTYAMGVVVHRSGTTGGNKYHVHRVILPDGSSLVLNKKKQRLESGSVFQENEKPVSPITAVSNAIISQDGGKNNKNMKKVYPGLTAANVEMGNIPENLRVRLENYKKVMAQIGYTVIYKPNRSVPKGTIGYADITNREVYLSPEYLSEALLAHELTHVIDKGYGGKYIKSLVSFFKKNLREDWDKAEARVRETYRDFPGANIEAETLADMCTKFTTDEYVKKAASMEVGTIKQIAVFCKYVGAKLNSIFLDKSNAQKFKVASLKWQMALYKATKKGAVDGGSGVAFSVKEIKGDSGTSYGIGVFLDSNLLTGLTEAERKQMVKEYVVSELNGESFIAYDKQGTPIDIRIAQKDEYFKNEKGNRRQVIKEIYSKYNGNKVKQEAVVLADELISTAEFNGRTPAKHKHDWLDDNGKNDWDIWEVYIQEKNKAVWKATLNVANTQNGEKILYDIGPIKMVEQAGESATSTTNYSISDVGENVNKNLLTNDDMLMAVSDDEGSAGVDTSAIEEEISIINEALKDESLPSSDRVALIKDKVRLMRKRDGGRDAAGKEDTARTKKLEDGVTAYRESGDTSGIPTRRSVAASKKYYDAKAADIEAELKQIDEALSNSENLSDMEYDELRNRRDALLTQWREAAKKNSVLAEVSDILDEIDTAARPNHTWVNEIAGWLSDKKNLIKFGTYNLNDVERNFKIFFGEHFKKAYDKIIQPLYDSKKAYVFGVTEYANRLKREIVDGLGIKKGSKMSAAVMWLGEGQKPVSKKAGAELAPYTYKDCVDEFGADAAKKIQKATEIFRKMYDELLDKVNETRAMLYPNNPDKLIPKREDYFRHFQEMSQGFEGLKNILQTNIGIDPMLVGVSENTKPKSKWQSYAQHRLGNSTTYDAVGGFLDYLPAAQYSIHIDPNIVNVRSLAYDLASAKAKENGGSGNPNANGFIAYLQRYANSLAGKTTSHFDRAIQDSNFGRTAMAVVSWLNNKTKASAVLGNINSVLSQVTNIKNVIGKIEHQSDVVQGAMDALAGLNPDGRIAERYGESGFLKERYLDRVFSQFDSGWQKVNPVKWAADLLGFADEIGTRITWNAAYNEAVRKNVENPVQYADNFTRACVAGRGIGEEALIFKSQVAKMFLPFRTEVLNDLRVQQDILFGTNDESNSPEVIKRVKNIMQLYVASMVVNAVLAAIKSDEFDPLDEAKEGYEENGPLGALAAVMEDYANGTGNPVAFDPIYDIVSGIYQGATEGESAGGKVGRSAQRVVQNLTGDLVSNNPFSTAVMGMIGFDNDASDLLFNGNVYVPGGIGMPLAGNVATVLRELGQGDYASAAAATVKPFLPLGTQIDRSIKGVYDYTKGYATNEAAYERMTGQDGDLKYLIEPSVGNAVRSVLFGPGAFSEESDAFYNDKTRKFTPEEQAEILSHKDYASRKVTFDDILAMNVYDSERDERKQAAAEEFFLGKEGTVIHDLYISGFDEAIPYKNIAGDASFTDQRTGKKYTLTLKADKLEKLTNEMNDKIAARYDRANDSDVFASLSQEEQVKYLNGVADAEYKQAKIKALYDNGQMGYEDYFRLESGYMESEARRDRVLYVDDTENYVKFNAADVVGQYISYSDFPVSEEGYEQLQQWRDYATTRKPDDVDAELLRLSVATGSDINVSGNPYGIISYTKSKVDYRIEMPDNQIYVLCDEVDKAVRSALSALFAKATYRNATAEIQKDLVASVKRDVRDGIKDKYKARYRSVKVDDFDRIVAMK